jgi:translation initiation factor 1
MNDERRLVYSTEHGRIRPAPPPAATPKAGDGIARVRRETAGRGGKTVTTISGLLLAEPALRELAKQLKQRCATGGHLREGVIEIQGDHRDAVIAALTALGHRVKRAGG